MTLRSLISFLAILTTAHFAFGQVLECGNPVPLDFRLYSSDKFEDSKEGIKTERRRIRKTKEDFLLASHYLNDAILNSGRVLFNDPVSSYLNDILDVILKDEPELRKQVRAYALRSTAVNAFATDNGVILVNLGLIARAESEAQLAFILSHELSHYTERHVLDAYLKNMDLFGGKGNYRDQGLEEKVLAMNLYSKDLEISADKAAFQRMSSSDYGTSGMLDVFGMLKYAHLPFENEPFDPSFLEMEGLVIDSSLLLKSVREPVAIDANEEIHSSHPAPTERKEVVLNLVATQGAHGGDLFVVSESRFDQVKELSRHEVVRLHQLANDPVMAIYSAYMMLKNGDYPSLYKEVVKALYSLSKYANHGRKQELIDGFSKQQGEAQQLVHALYKMNDRELNVLALRHSWELGKTDPGDPDVKAMNKDLIRELIYRHHNKLRFNEVNDESLIGRERIENALVPLFKDTAFKKLFHQCVMDSRQRMTIQQKKQKFKDDQKLEQFHKKHGFAVGAEKVVFVDPQYGRYDLRRNKQKLFKSSEASGILLGERIERAAELVRLPIEILSSEGVDSMEADKFNDITFLNEWVDQRFRGLDMDMTVQDRTRLDSIIAKYGTEHFVWTGLLNYREKKPFLFYYLMYALVPPAIPVALYYLFRPNYDSYYFCISFNLRTGEPEMVTYNNFKQKDARDVVNANVYDSLYQLKRKPNKKGK